eukprot:c25224_g2_i1 orf=271-558(+)
MGVYICQEAAKESYEGNICEVCLDFDVCEALLCTGCVNPKALAIGRGVRMKVCACPDGDKQLWAVVQSILGSSREAELIWFAHLRWAMWVEALWL